MRRVSLPRLFVTSFALSALCISAASAAVSNRISAAIAGNTRVAIPNSVHGKVRLATDLGPVAANLKLEDMTLAFSLTDAQQAALNQLLLDQQNPASPRYHQWLTPAQYAAQFGLSSADIAKVTAWLTSQGFTITEVANSGTFVRFSGTAAQAQSAFATSIHTLSLNGETHFANVTDPALPASLAGVVSAITGLHDFKLKSRIRTRTVDGGVAPKFTSSQTGAHYLAPGDFYTIYNEIPLFNNAITGAGQSIAVMGQIDISLADIAAFRAASGLSVNVPTIKTYGTDPGGICSTTSTSCSPNLDDLNESSLDVEWSGATAPGATIIFVNSTNVFTSLTDAIDNNIAPIISISYGECEAAAGISALNSFNQVLKQANAFGITVVAPSGDDGASDCDSGPLATDGLSVDFPGSSPYATSMGGTMFNEGLGSSVYWSSSETTLTAGTLVNAATRSALSYIPEMVWNEDATGQTFSAGGGGVSNFFSKPAWQHGLGVPVDASRDVPDLSMNAAANHDGYLYCVQSSCATGFRTAGGNLTVAGGTSFAAPTFAGILALIEQKIGSRVANANQTIYALGNTPVLYGPISGTVFNDILSGNNDSPCLAGTPNCSGAPIGYSAGLGYDLATGWGTVNAYNLATDWNLVAPLGLGSLGSNISTTTLSTSSSSVVAGTTVTLTATVSGTAGPLPSGTVQFLVNNSAIGTPVTLVSTSGSSTASYAYVTSCSTLGAQVIAASYSGDATYAGSKAAGITSQGFVSQFSTATPIQIQVTSGVCPDFTISAPVPATVTSGSPTVVLTVAPLNGFVGTVAFSATAVETSSATPTFSFNPGSVAITSTASATTTLTLNNIVASLRAPAAPGKPDSRAPWYVTGSGVTVASLLCFILPRRRRLGSLLLVALSVALIAGATGCGSAKNGTVGPGSTNVNVGTYTVTVTGTYTPTTGSPIAHSTAVQFTVQ